MAGTLGSLSELFSDGKSGSLFYFSHDALYLIKTLPSREMRALKQLLPEYARYVESNPHTLLPRFFGAHSLEVASRQLKLDFVVMANVFSTERAIHERYDLKVRGGHVTPPCMHACMQRT